MKSKLAGVLPAVASPCNENDVFLEDRFAELITSLCKESIEGYLLVVGAFALSVLRVFSLNYDYVRVGVLALRKFC